MTDQVYTSQVINDGLSLAETRPCDSHMQGGNNYMIDMADTFPVKTLCVDNQRGFDHRLALEWSE